MSSQVGRIYFAPKEPPHKDDCQRCAHYRKAIEDYLDEYVNRNISQEGKALAKLREALDENNN